MDKNKSWLDDDRTPDMIQLYKNKGVYLEEKTGWFWSTLAWLLCIVTFGIYKREKFLIDFATTIGTKVGIPRSWTFQEAEFVMPHEARHVWQGKVCGFYISAWVGLPIFFLLYVFLPIPVGFAYFRYLFEKDATRETVRILKNQGKSFPDLHHFIDRCAEIVASGSYVWPVPKKFAVKGYQRMLDEVCDEK